MLLRRMIEHVRNQNWLAVVLDFFIVVFGVLLANQIGNWNEQRNNELAYQQALDRVVIEAKENLEVAEAFKRNFMPYVDELTAAISDLHACDVSPEAVERIRRSLWVFRVNPEIEFRSTAAFQLITSDRLLARQSSAERVMFADYADELETLIEYSQSASDYLADWGAPRHPRVIFDVVGEPVESSLSGSRRPRLNGEIETLCKDKTFIDQYVLTEMTSQYQLGIADWASDITHELLTELDSENYSTLVVETSK